MKTVKCPVCKNRIPAYSAECPICTKEFTVFQRYRMVWLKRIILGIVALAILYNSVVIIHFNNHLRKYIKSNNFDGDVVEELIGEYNELSRVQKMFVHVSELKYMKKSTENYKNVESVENTDLSVIFNRGKISGVYSGDVIDSVPNGIGKFEFVGDDGLGYIYNGEFKDGVIAGQGILIDENGKKYEGAFVNGELSGQGIVSNSAGKVIESGKFVNGKLNGFGTMFDDDGNTIYEGNFIDDIPLMNEYQKSCEPMELNDFIAGENAFAGRNIKIIGIVTNVYINSNERHQYIVTSDYGDGHYVCVEDINDSKTFRVGDKLNIYGYSYGIKNYTDSTLQNKTGPVVGAFYVFK